MHVLRSNLNRRRLLTGTMALGAGAALSTLRSVPASTATTAQATPDTGAGPYTLPPLPYDFAALEPHIDAQTMQIHHDKHHATYVKNLNAAVEGLPDDLRQMSPEELIRNLDRVPEDKRTTVRNNGGGHVNHTMFWEIMGPNESEPTGALADAINTAFGDLAAMQEAVNKAGAGRFGSGWAWVILDGEGNLAVTSTPNQDSPLMADLAEASGTPILGVDVWEHAYYLKYQNRRPDYLTAWWNTVNWDAVNRRFEAAVNG